jgi:hypothetical protein
VTADVVDLRRQEMRREADRIAEARADAIAAHPSTRSKQLAQVERQQVLGALVKTVAEGNLDLTDTDVLPLVVDVLLRNCPQAYTAPEIVAKSLEEAAECYGAQEGDELFGESAAIVGQLAAGTAHTATYDYLLDGVRALADWLTAAAVVR